MSTGALEEANYVDTGCPDGMLPSCLSCPLPRCRYEPGFKSAVEAQQKARREQQRLEIERLRAAGLVTREIAEVLGISPRSVHRRSAA